MKARKKNNVKIWFCLISVTDVASQDWNLYIIKGDLAAIQTVCPHQGLLLRSHVDQMTLHSLQWLNHSYIWPYMHKSPQTPWVALCPASPQRPVFAFKWHWAPNCTRSQLPRLSHPLINSTQHHFLHSLTVPSSCVCVLASEARTPPMTEIRGGRKSVGRGVH